MASKHRRMERCDIMKMNNLRKIQRQRHVRGSDGASALQYLYSLSSENPLMFVRHIVDKDNRVQHVFWCDDRSQLDFQVFGDVVAFDATYGKNKYKAPAVIFFGVNNHNQTIVFAVAVIENELEET
ncbi:hypothetical protein JHK82_012148 [Glycine max]|nr:hypothetical protein JHK82_012148 [Glycine max]